VRVIALGLGELKHVRWELEFGRVLVSMAALVEVIVWGHFRARGKCWCGS